MAVQADEKDSLIYAVIQDYSEKIFYFCLKKSGNVHEAEDLASDITLNIIASLDKGIIPEKLSAWIWRIARNRYSVWADKKHKQAVAEESKDISDFEIKDNAYNPEEEFVNSENLSLLRRELAMASSDYRNILVAYYFKGNKINDIARSLNIPAGTVMSKLYRARKILKEGMEMAREFGKRSYKPESISFYASGNQPSGLPWSAIKRKIPVNILCQAHNNPSTLQELSLELGIAAPYMEEEVELLVKAELLKKVENNKYLTNFFIVPVECQNRLNEVICAFAEKHAAAIWQLAEPVLKKADELGVTFGNYSINDAKMYFALYLEQLIETSSFKGNIFSHFKRSDGGNWGIIGFEEDAVCRLPSSFFNNNGNGWIGTSWKGYQAQTQDAVFSKRRYKKDVPDYYLNATLNAIVKDVPLTQFSEAEKENLQKLTNEGFCAVQCSGRPYVNAIVFKDKMEVQLKEYLCSLAGYKSLSKDMRNCIDTTKEIVAEYSNKYLKEDFEFYAAMSIVELRSVFARLWKDSGMYSGDSAQFCAFFC